MRKNVSLKNLVTLSALLGLAGVGIYILSAQYQTKLFNEFLSPLVTSGGTVVSQKDPLIETDYANLAALRLQWFAAIQRVSPLFAIEGANLEKMEIGIKKLYQISKEFPPLYPAKESRILEAYGYPIPFLQALVKLEEARRDFLGNPSDKKALEYQKTLITTINVYRDDIHRAIAILEELEKEFTDIDLAFWGGAANYKSFQEALETADAEAIKRLTAAKKRWRCYRGYAWACTSLESEKKLLAQYLTLEAAVKADPTTPPQSIYEIQKIIRAFVMKKEDRIIQELSKPLIGLSFSRCYSHLEKPFYYLWREVDTEDSLTFKSALLNDIYFFDLSAAPEDWFLGQIYEATRVPYLQQPPTNYYFCPDGGKEAAILSTFYEIYTTLKEGGGIFQNYKSSNNDFRQLAELERKIITPTEGMIYEAVIRQYIENLARVFAEYSEHEIAEVLVSKESILKINRLLLIALQQSPRLEELLSQAVEFNAANKPLKELGALADIHSLILTRTYPMLLFQIYNGSIIQLPVTFFAKRDNLLTDSNFAHIISYTKNLRNEFSPADTVLRLQESNVLHNNILIAKSLDALRKKYQNK